MQPYKQEYRGKYLPDWFLVLALETLQISFNWPFLLKSSNNENLYKYWYVIMHEKKVS